jgi:ankyrin repeat protein
MSRGVWQFGSVSSLQLSASQVDEDSVLQLLRAGADPGQSFAIPVMSALCTTDLSLPTFGDDITEWQLVTPLIWAVKNRKVATVKFLLEQTQTVCIDVNAVPLPSSGLSYPASSSSWTPLMWAIANLAEDVATGTALASEVASISSSNHAHSAAHQIFDFLSRFPGLNPNAGSVFDAATPLSLAAALGLQNVIHWLVHAGASFPETFALVEATAFAHPHCLQLMCRMIMEQHSKKSLDILSLIPPLVQCLDVAARYGLLECAQIISCTFSDLMKMCSVGADFKADWEKGLSSVLLQSCDSGQPHMTSFFLPLAQFSPFVLGLALRHASKNGDTASCKHLLSVGASGDWVDPHQQKLRSKGGSRTAVSAAFKRWGRTGLANYEAICSLLLGPCSSGAVNIRDSHGSTPLKWAAIRGHHVFVRALLDKGADVFAEDSDGNTPISHAVMHGHDNIIDELVEREPQLYKARIKVPSYFKVFESGLLPPNIPLPSRSLHLSISETTFKSKTTIHVPNVLCVRSYKDLKLVESLNPILASAHLHELVFMAGSELLDSPHISEHLNILKIRDMGSSCPELPLPQHVCVGDVISEVAVIGMRVPMMRLIRAANNVGKGVAHIRSSDGDSLLMLCCGHNWRDEVIEIIENGCPVDVPSRDDPLMTAITWAAHKGHSDIVCDLLHAGALHAQNALLIATCRCHVTVVEAMCRVLASKPASQRPDTSCSMLIAAAHGSAPAISALASISPVSQVIPYLRCSCTKGISAVFLPVQPVLSDVSQQSVFSLIDRDPKDSQCFRWLLPGAYGALLQSQFEQRAILKQLEWESDNAVMGFNFKNKLMHAHQDLSAMFGSEDWALRLKRTRASLLSSCLPDERSRPASRESGFIVDQKDNGNSVEVSIQDSMTSEFPHMDSFFVSENVKPLVCIHDDGLLSIQKRRQTMRSAFWTGVTCSLQLSSSNEQRHSIISTNGRDLSDATWLLLIPDTTPLHMAAASGSSEALKLLLNLIHHHPPPYSIPPPALSDIDSSGLTPLCYAGRFADVDMCALLLDQGADIMPWEKSIQRTVSWLTNRRHWRSLLSALVSIHAADGDLPLIPHSNEEALPGPSEKDECDGLVCVPCVLWAALSGSEAKTRLLVEAGADAASALTWIQQVGFGYCQENNVMYKLAVQTMANSLDYVLMGPYAPTARAGDEIEGIEPIPSIDSFPISSYKRHEVPSGHRVQIIAAILGWNDWSLRKLITFHDVPQDHYAVTASNSGKSQQLPGKPDLIQAVQLHVDEFICEAVVVIGTNYILGVRFTTNQRVLPWMGRNWGDDECKIQRVIRCSPQGREICGFFGLKAASGHGRLLHLGFATRLRGGPDCMRRHRHGLVSNTSEWEEPVKLFSMEDMVKRDIKDAVKGKIGTTPRSNTPWMRSPLPGRGHSPLNTQSPSASLLKDFEDSEEGGVETAVMNHVWTESPKWHGGSKSKFIASVSSDTSLQPSPARLRTSSIKKQQRPPTSFANETSVSLPNLSSSGRISDGNTSAPTSPTPGAKQIAHRKEETKKKDTV